MGKLPKILNVVLFGAGILMVLTADATLMLLGLVLVALAAWGIKEEEDKKWEKNRG